MALSAYILHTSKSSFKFHMHSVETFCKIDEKRTFNLILVLFGVKKDHKIWPLGGPYYTLLELVSLKSKFLANPVETFLHNRWKKWLKRTQKYVLHTSIAKYKIYEKLTSKIWPLGAMIYLHLKVPLICLWTKWHGPVLKTFRENDKKIPKSQLWSIFYYQKSIKKKI